jgi:hypothetical protein
VKGRAGVAFEPKYALPPMHGRSSASYPASIRWHSSYLPANLSVCPESY